MANQHHSPEPGRSPGKPITAARPNCTDPQYECTWVPNPAAATAEERFKIKIFNGGCQHSRKPADDPPPAAEPSDAELRAWLTGDAA